MDSRVWVHVYTMSADDKLIGRLAMQNADTIGIDANGAVTRIPIRSIDYLAVSKGRNHPAGAARGALWGAGVGLGVGVFGALTGKACTNYGNGAPEVCEPLGRGEQSLLSLVTTGLGALLGTAVGAAIGRESWEGMWVRLSLAPSR